MKTPPLPDALKARWAIVGSQTIADTHTSLIYRILLDDGTNAVVKRLKPNGLGEIPGMAFLRWRDGHGAVRLLDVYDNDFLLEDGGELLLRHHRLERGEAAANDIIATLIPQLHAASATPAPDALISLHDHFQPLFSRAERETESRLRDALRLAASLTQPLLDSQTGIRPLHGDLHHDNIISGKRGWLAIDPQGLLGDPAYDVANVFGNPLGAGEAILDPLRIRSLMRVFAPVIGCNEEKILRYAIAHAGLSICWSLEDGGTMTESENARERLAFIETARQLLPPAFR